MSPFSRFVAVFATLLIAGGALPAQTPSPVSSDVTVLLGGENDVGIPLIRPTEFLLIDDRVIVLDEEEPFLRVVSLDGSALQLLGMSGGGPGEFRYGAAMAHSAASGQLVVFDPLNGRANIYHVGDSVAFVRGLSIALSVNSACFMGPRLFVATNTVDGIIHELRFTSNTLEVVRSFGRPVADHPASEMTLFRNFVADGSLACDAANGTIALASRLVGPMQLLSANTAEQRTVLPEDFFPLLFEVADSNGLRQKVPPSQEYDQVEALRIDAAGSMILSVARNARDANGDPGIASYRQITIPRTGPQTVSPRHSWMRIGIIDSTAVCYQRILYPTVATVRGERCP